MHAKTDEFMGYKGKQLVCLYYLGNNPILFYIPKLFNRKVLFFKFDFVRNKNICSNTLLFQEDLLYYFELYSFHLSLNVFH